MVLVFSLPFCLLLPDGDYKVKLAKDDIITINLTKVIPKIFDERLPSRGFVKGEFENVSKMRITNLKTGESKELHIEEISKINTMHDVIYYITKEGKKIIPKIDRELIETDVNLYDNVIIDPKKLKRIIVDNKDLTDQILSEKRELGRSIIINGEINKDRFGRFRYSKVRYTSNKKLSYNEEFKRSIRAINLLIDKYRLLTQDYWITKIHEKDIFIFMDVEEHSFEFSHTEKGISQFRPDHEDTIVDTLKQELVDIKPDFPFKQLRLDAINAFEESNYHLSIIYSITALESIIKTFLSIYLSMFYPQIQKQVIKMPLSSLVTIILRFLLQSDKLNNILPGIQSAIILRNRIIHEAELNISENQAKKVIEDVNKFIEFIAREFTNLIESKNGIK